MMYPVFFHLAGQIYEPTDIEDALRAIEAMANSTHLPVRIAIEAGVQLNTLIGVKNLSYTKASFQFNSIKGDIVTRRAIRAAGPEIILTVCPTEKLLQSFQSFPEVKVVFVIPDNSSDQPIYHWLQLHSAKNLITQQDLQGIAPCSQEMNRAIGYLKDYSRKLNVDLTHTSIQYGILAIVANTLKKYHITSSPDSIYKQALQRDLLHSEAEVLVKYFMHKSLFPDNTNANYANYWQTLQDVQWEHN